MKEFANLLDGLVYMPSRNGKIRLLTDYLARTPDPDRGWALAALTGGLDLKTAKPALVRGLVVEKVDPELFALSYDYVGDLAETVSLIWPEPADKADGPGPSLTEVVETLQQAGRSQVPALITGWLDRLDAPGRYALLKLITGGLRVGVSARLAKTAATALRPGVDIAEVEELWHGLKPPYGSLFAWLAAGGEKPSVDDIAGFRPMMLAHPLEEPDIRALDVAAYRAEWKWDGIRVQLVARGGTVRLYSRTGDDIGGAFPDVIDRVGFDAVLDGELLVLREGRVAPFNDLQQRLNRKTVTAKQLREHPAHIRAYDILFDGAEDLRRLPFDVRRTRLEAFHAREDPAGLDLSEQLSFGDWDGLAAHRDGARDNAIEGLMLKRGDSAYVAGRPKGPWFKWKRDPLRADAVLMYAQRGHGKRSSFYSDYTFGVWRAGELVPVGKAYFGFTDEELRLIDKWVRDHTVRRYGPVREVEQGLVFEVAFDSIHPSKRHKSGLAMRFPRIHRIRWDKPAEEADVLETLEHMVVA
ncbi:MAG: cisplatin damage response ATP-dependent DNA ligase [Alphaproteobacteria bacterium]|nr:cisplatin damage response ATP-dependent DNA ligase [Alphaproteobacteria bacterium]